MAKSSGLGMACYVDGYDLSGDIGSFSNIGGSQKTIDVTGIDKFGPERLGGQRDGTIDFVAYFNVAMGRAHPVLSALPTSDGSVMACVGTAIGSPAACMIGKQLNYDGTRAQSGDFTFKTNVQANGFGLEWATLLTGAGASIRTDVAATNGPGYDGLAATAFGLQAYLEVTGFTGTDVTIKLQDSADNVAFADLAGAAFAQVSAANQGQRIAISNAATVRRYLRVSTTTVGGFTSCSFAVAAIRNPILGQVF